MLDIKIPLSLQIHVLYFRFNTYELGAIGIALNLRNKTVEEHFTGTKHLGAWENIFSRELLS